MFFFFSRRDLLILYSSHTSFNSLGQYRFTDQILAMFLLFFSPMSARPTDSSWVLVADGSVSRGRSSWKSFFWSTCLTPWFSSTIGCGSVTFDKVDIETTVHWPSQSLSSNLSMVFSSLLLVSRSISILSSINPMKSMTLTRMIWSMQLRIYSATRTMKAMVLTTTMMPIMKKSSMMNLQSMIGTKTSIAHLFRS